MWFERKKTKQEQFLDELYWDSSILKEMIGSYKKDRKMLLDLLRDRVRHTKPDVDYDYDASSAVFGRLCISWCWLSGDRHIRAQYKDNELPNDIAKDLYRLYRIVWCGDTEVIL